MNHQRYPHRPESPPTSHDRKEGRPSRLARVGGMIVVTIVLGGVVAAVMVGIITFAFFFVLLGIIFVVLLLIALLFGRGRLHIQVVRRVEPRQGPRDSSKPHRNV